MAIKNFNVKTDVFFGIDSLNMLREIKNKNVIVITDSFMVKSKISEKIQNLLESCNVTVFDQVIPNPDIEIISRGIREFIKSKPDVIIALGGGSPIDAAKVMREIYKKFSKDNYIKLIAIPTTSGTGSEVTKFSVISDTYKGIKYPLVLDSFLPDIAILSPELVKSAPSNITADTGMDVITHALEAYMSINASDFSDALAEKALVLAFEYLPKAYENKDDLVAREKMHNASCMAGISFNSVNLGLNHGIAHTIGGRFHISHGRINAILLPIIIEYNADFDNYQFTEYSYTATKLYRIAKLLNFPSQNVRIGVKNLVNEIKQLNRLMRIPSTLKELGVNIQEFKLVMEELAEKSLQDSCTKSNPRIPTKDDVIKIINKILQ